MKFKLAILLCFSITTVFTQDLDTLYKVYDFSDVDVSKIKTDVIARQLDSIYRTSGYDSLSQLLNHVRKSTYTEKYVSFNIGYQSSHASLDGLNSGISMLGFSELSEKVGGVPWGIDVRGKRFLLTYLVVPAIKNKATDGDGCSVEVNGINMQLALGYDIVQLRRLHVYPQLAFGLQHFDIETHRNNATKYVVTATDLLINPAGTTLEKRSFDMSYGLEVDYHLLYSTSSSGVIVGLR